MDEKNIDDKNIDEKDIDDKNIEGMNTTAHDMAASAEENTAAEAADTQAYGAHFGSVGPAIALYALIFGCCLYKNPSGIMTIITAAATVACICYCSYRTGFGERAVSRKLYPYYIGIILLGISICCTADMHIIRVNYFGMLLLALSSVIRIFYNEINWGIRKYFSVMLELILSALMYFSRPFCDYRAHRKIRGRRKSDTVKYVIAGIFIAIPFVCVATVLLASADIVFYGILENTLNMIDINDINLIGDGFGLVFMIVTVFICVYCMFVNLTSKNVWAEVDDNRRFEPVIGITFTGMLTFIYMIFSGIQIMYLFTNSLNLPEQYCTYSDYAREGFFQLLAVAFMNLLIVLFCVSFFRKSRVLDIVIIVMSACTYVMIASSAVRMLMYIRAYNLTYLRIQVLLALLMIAFVMAGLIIRIFREKFHLMRYITATIGAIWIVFSFCRPEYIIAKYNISQFEVIGVEGDTEIIEAGSENLTYLLDLGADAAPAMYELAYDISDGKIKIAPEGMANEKYFMRFIDDFQEGPDIRSFNLSRYKAYKCSEAIKALYD